MPNSEKPYQGDHKATMRQATVKAWSGRPYPAHKESGVEWLGKVPEHWEMARLKGVVTNVMDLTKELQCDDIYLALEHVESWTGRFSVARDGVDFDSQVKKFGAGDVLFGKLRPYLAKVVCPENDGVCSGEFLVLRPRHTGLLPKYLEQLLRSKPVILAIDASTFGAKMPRADWQFIGNMRIPLPPLPEQHAIAHFLDHATQRIQHHIHAKQKLIKLLEEQKQVIIHQEAVTGQINVQTGQPYPVYKDSGIEWLGEVPEHWEMRRARYIFREVDRRSRDGVGQHLSMSQRLGLVPSHLVENRTLVSESYAGGKLCDVGDLVLNRLKAHLGVFACAHHEGIVSPDYTVLRLKKTGIMEYFEQTLRSSGYRTELRIRAKGIVEGFWRLYTDDFNEIRIPVPPDLEQARIAAWIRSVADYTHRLAASYNRHIDLLHEYRTRLISDVVTGKLDVREAAAHLPESNLPTVAANCQDGTELADRGRSPHP